MKNNMKLIMESWKKNLLLENDPKQVGATLEDELEAVFDVALGDLEKELEDKLNEEVITIVTVLVFLWKAVLGAAGMGSLLTKFSKFWMDKFSSQPTSGLDRVESFFDGVFETFATFGTKFFVKKVIEKVSDPNNLQENMDKVDSLYKMAAILIGLGVAGFEIAKATAASGGSYADYIKGLFSKAGIDNAAAAQATADAFEKTVGGAGDVFDGAKFIKQAAASILNIIRRSN